MSEVRVISGSVEYLYADIRADHVLGTQAVEMSLSNDATPGPWVAAEWVGDPGKYAAARVLLDGTLTPGIYNVYVKISDQPEVPIIFAGRMRIV